MAAIAAGKQEHVALGNLNSQVPRVPAYDIDRYVQYGRHVSVASAAPRYRTECGGEPYHCLEQSSAGPQMCSIALYRRVCRSMTAAVTVCRSVTAQSLYADQ